MTSVYLYAVSYDLGFAPNPFGGLCTLACCKPKIREKAQVGDWVIGMTGVKTRPALRCVFAMIVSNAINFDEYWTTPEFRSRRPVRNGTPKKLVGDNIYHRLTHTSPWSQENSVHSNHDGSQCPLNTAHDTRINRVLISDRFIYFGSKAPEMPHHVRDEINYYKNPRDYRRFDINQAKPIVDWLEPQLIADRNKVLSPPINFKFSEKRYSIIHQRMI